MKGNSHYPGKPDLYCNKENEFPEHPEERDCWHKIIGRDFLGRKIFEVIFGWSSDGRKGVNVWIKGENK